MKKFSKRIVQRLLPSVTRSCSPQAVVDYPEPLSITHSHPPPAIGYSQSCINKLPVELFRQIFLLIVDDIPDYPCIFSVEDTTVTISANFNSPPPSFHSGVLHLESYCTFNARDLVAHPGHVSWAR
jgi:hypothetical protein